MITDSRQIEVVDDAVAEILAKKAPAERLKIAFGIWHSTVILLSNCLKSLHPEWDDKMVQREVIRRISYGAV